MKTISLFPKHLTPCVFVLAFSCIMATSCIKNSDDNDQPKPPVNDSIPMNTDSTAVDIDRTFKATVEYMQGEWMAQYAGYDPQQSQATGMEVVSAIRRLVTFSPEGFYDSHVQGIVDVQDTITIYKEFEHEHGTYSFNADKQVMKYVIEYDSLLNFGTDKMEFFPGKRGPGGLVKEYDEEIGFSKEVDGKRDWIRKDLELMSTEDHSANVIYIMKKLQ